VRAFEPLHATRHFWRVLQLLEQSVGRDAATVGLAAQDRDVFDRDLEAITERDGIAGD
jgi:hypothetical protein